MLALLLQHAREPLTSPNLAGRVKAAGGIQAPHDPNRQPGATIGGFAYAAKKGNVAPFKLDDDDDDRNAARHVRRVRREVSTGQTTVHV